ncbi:glucuronyl esterase domain-containing protein [Dyadobacter pollutisoli]|uniref:Acetylxylan esterase n=1 Tax=Dyadobacter pollutisoli TaxID=2910158 RepID=A0A9E8NHC9_9BACT|nr:acetylxylan esterase [Dyadobacter pollutisoli]WAC14666.1 acetylxylan esterase [Dyadobacter pollutisoli]
MTRTLLLGLFVALSFAGLAQPAANRPTVVAGFPVNYQEDSVGTYTLPELLKSLDGKTISTAKQWTQQRRPELVKLFEENQFGKMPSRPQEMTFKVFDKGTSAFNGKAIRKQVTVYFTKDTSDHKMNLLIYIPASAKKPVPLLMNISFAAYNQTIEDTGLLVNYIWKDGKRIKADQPTVFGKMNVEQFLDAGIGFATVYYGDIEPDFKDGIKYGIRQHYLKPGQTETAANEWGAIAAWSWGLARAMDYFETDKQIDSKRVALQGASRLGKTALWAGVKDTRYKMVIASISGEGGAALSRRNYGETIRHISDPSRYLYQFAPNYHSYADNVASMPVDAHMLVALMAPRPLLLQTGSTDYWSDPKGEFLSAVAAAPVYKLFNEKGPETTDMPAAGDTSLLMNELGYYMHEGGHTVLPTDWTHIISYMKKYL